MDNTRKQTVDGVSVATMGSMTNLLRQGMSIKPWQQITKRAIYCTE